jgi:outer membrane lipoprotein-sorting protein
MKLRVDSKAGLFSVRYVINGKRKSTQVPGLHINKVKDITGKPGMEQSMLDSGIITPGFLADSVESRFVGYQKLDGRKVPEFEFWYTDEPNSRHHFVWMDPAKRYVLRHDVFNRSGGLKMRFVFKQPTKAAGVWVPTRVEVYNAELRQAAVTQYTNIRVNTGLSESLFRI